MKIIALTAAALLTAAPAFATVTLSAAETARILAERSDPWHIKHLGPVVAPIVATTPLSAVPEPASWAMMLAGFGLVGAVIRRRQTLSVTA